nr:twitch domain-containing radical SAM protein [Asanoa ferruginea]
MCVLPWLQMIVRADGQVQVCNRMSGFVENERRPVNVSTASPTDIWNARGLVEMRHRMLTGERVDACSECYLLEERGAESLRLEMLRRWEAGFLNEGRHTLEVFMAERRPTATDGPRWIQGDLGNRCNLACRMCNSGASSKILHDPVHGRWSGPALDATRQTDAWYGDPVLLAGLLTSAPDLRQLHIIGGEPTLMTEIDEVLDLVVQTGRAPQIELSFHTNASRPSAPWFKWFAHFRAVVAYISVDGAEEDYEYIRYPAKWPRFTKNLEQLLTVEGLEVRAHVVVQAYNVLRIGRLLAFLEQHGVRVDIHLLAEPAYLDVQVLPPSARRLARERIATYADVTADADLRGKLLGICEYLSAEHVQSPEVAMFMTFTNDIDASRRQNIRISNPELVAAYDADGMPWQTTYRHADRPKGDGG